MYTKRIKGGTGYYNTSRYPAGGDFCRAPKEGALIAIVDKPYDATYGRWCGWVKVVLAESHESAIVQVEYVEDVTV